MSDEKGANWFQLGVAAVGVIVTALLGLGQWQISRQQKASEERKAIDNIEVQVMALIAPRLPELRGSDEKARTSQRVVSAAARYLTTNYQRPGLAQIYNEILEDIPSVDPVIRTQVEEATQPAMQGSPWYAVLASLPADDLKAAHNMANEKLRDAESKGFQQKIRLYRTKISDHYAVVIGDPESQSKASLLAASARKTGLAPDAFAQADRSWELIGEAPFK